MAIASINPTTGETTKTFEALNEAQIDEKLQLAAETFRSYRRTTFAERASMTSLRALGARTDLAFQAQRLAFHVAKRCMLPLAVTGLTRGRGAIGSSTSGRDSSGMTAADDER